VMCVMFFFADQLAILMNSEHAATGIKVLAPAVFFVCVISVFRGYAQGFQDMIPTATSQLIEVVCKAAFGISIAFYLAGAGLPSQYVSAGAITGVTIGLGLCIPVMIVYKKKTDKINIGTQSDNSDQHELPGRFHTLMRFLRVSVVISLSASFMSIMGVVDTSVVSSRLQNALGFNEAQAMAELGLFRRGLSIYNLPPSLVVPLAVSMIPAIAAAVARNNKDESNTIMQSSIKLTNLFAMPACAGIMVLAGPILKALFVVPGQSAERFATTAVILTILGAASYFVCLQHMTIATLQANGYERVALLTFPAGAIVRIALSYFLVGNPNIGILGSPVATLACFAVIVILNVIFILVKIKARMNIISGFLRPLLCTVVMAIIAYFTYEGIYRVGSGIIGTGVNAVRIYLAVAILVGIVSYFALVIFTRVIKREDLIHFPKGEKAAKFLRVK